MFLLERRRQEERATFVQAAGRWLWLKVFLAGVLLATSFTVIFVANERDGTSIVENVKRITSVDVVPAGMNQKKIASVNQYETSMSTTRLKEKKQKKKAIRRSWRVG